jgi:dihydroorotase/N-acyl-D-amino-acid deacylase
MMAAHAESSELPGLAARGPRGRDLLHCALVALLGWALAQPSFAQAPSYDLLLRNGRVVDGAGNPWYRADMAIGAGTIVRIAPLISDHAARVIDVGGQVIAPGFIDVHTHARRGIFDAPTADNYVRQGVTTVMEGADGSSPVPIGPFLAKLEALPKSLNIGTFIGQGSIRSAIIGEVNRQPTADELDRMRALVDEAMTEGAFGLSSGLFYVPGIFTPIEEVIELAKVAGRRGGHYNSHMRDEASGVVASVQETIAVGERGGLPTHVSHHKVIGQGNWGRSVETLRLIDEARARGIDVTIDQYPYTASSTRIQAALLPAWALEGGTASVLRRLAEPETRARIKAEVVRIIRTERGGGDPKNVVVAYCAWNDSLGGRNLGEIARLRGLEPTVENAAEAALWLTEQGGCQGVFHAMSEEDLERIMRHPATMIASDGEIPIGMSFPKVGVPHPRSYGTFARVLAVYVRERKVISLEDAVRKMTSLPAQRLGLNERGVLRPGMRADIAVFDPARVRDAATYDKPHQYAEGFSYVIVNGEVVFESGAMTAARPGQVLYGPAKAAINP